MCALLNTTALYYAYFFFSNSGLYRQHSESLDGHFKTVQVTWLLFGPYYEREKMTQQMNLRQHSLLVVENQGCQAFKRNASSQPSGS